jgi:hypothetical protein
MSIGRDIDDAHCSWMGRFCGLKEKWEEVVGEKPMADIVRLIYLQLELYV